MCHRRRAGEDLPPPPGTAIPGPEFFGLMRPSIVSQIEQLDSQRQCGAYWQGKRVRCNATCAIHSPHLVSLSSDTEILLSCNRLTTLCTICCT